MGGSNMDSVLALDEQSECDSNSESNVSSDEDEGSIRSSALPLPLSSTVSLYTKQPSPVSIPPNSIGLTYLHSFLSAAECAQLIELSAGSFSRSTVGYKRGEGYVSPGRTSFSAALSSHDPLVARVRARVAELTGARDSQIERLAVVRYLPGQQYKPHYDSSRDDSPRSHTIFAYLNDVPGGGGETEFTKLGVKFKPKCGDALFWENRRDRESYRLNGEHAGRPPLSGTKYGQWLAGSCLIALLLAAAV
jgi:prolyl 4-hydroxylase